MDDPIFSHDASKNSRNLSYILPKNEGQKNFLDWKKKADEGIAKAQYEVAKAYHNGIGVQQNQQLAFQYCKMAADQGHSEAQNTLGTYFDQEKEVEKSPQDAFKYFQLAADQGHALAIYQTLQKSEIKYPGSQEIDISNYLSNNNIDTLKTILSLFENRPAHLYMTKTNYAEIMVIREAMINNPKLCFLCSD